MTNRDKNPFDEVAPFYDKLMNHVNYPGWVRETRCVAACLEKDHLRALDVACGTGTFAVSLARKTGWQVVGLDSSVGMVRCGRSKLEPADTVRLVVGDMQRPCLQNGFDIIVSLFDSVNFVLTVPELTNMFGEIYRLLAPGGIFFFDVITECNVVRNFEGEPWEERIDGTPCQWSSAFDTERKLVYTTLDIRDISSLLFVERIFDDTEIRGALAEAGLEIVTVVEAHTWDRPTRAAERVEYVVSRSESETHRAKFENIRRQYIRHLPA